MLRSPARCRRIEKPVRRLRHVVALAIKDGPASRHEGVGGIDEAGARGGRKVGCFTAQKR